MASSWTSALVADAGALVASFTYAAALLVAAELARRACGVRTHITRKVVHIAAGLWVLPSVFLFASPAVGVLPFAAFIAVNAALLRLRVLPSIDPPDASAGTVWFAAAITALFATLWSPATLPIALAAALALTLGDAAAALVGTAYGTRRYRLLPSASVRSLEGSAAMFCVTAVAVWLCLAVLPPLLPGGAASEVAWQARAASSWYGGLPMALTALLVAVVATAVEAGSPSGIDNALVPLAVAILLLL